MESYWLRDANPVLGYIQTGNFVFGLNCKILQFLGDLRHILVTNDKKRFE